MRSDRHGEYKKQEELHHQRDFLVPDEQHHRQPADLQVRISPEFQHDFRTRTGNDPVAEGCQGSPGSRRCRLGLSAGTLPAAATAADCQPEPAGVLATAARVPTPPAGARSPAADAATATSASTAAAASGPTGPDGAPAAARARTTDRSAEAAAAATTAATRFLRQRHRPRHHRQPRLRVREPPQVLARHPAPGAWP